MPLEVLLAAGLTAVDLNNVFVAAGDPMALVERAQEAGFPQTCCCWTRGLYGAVHALGLRRVIAVIQGDCSNTHALAEMLRYEGVECVPFDYPYQRDAAAMGRNLENLAARLGADMADAQRWQGRLAPLRVAAAEIDRLTWQEGKVSGLENHLWLVSTSDFGADADAWHAAARSFLAQAVERKPLKQCVRLAFVGVPPIMPGLYEHLAASGGRVVFNETQRQFSMPGPQGTLAEQYTRYTYPYGIFARVEDVRAECARRAVDGVIHYVQSFCFRRIEDRILREQVGLPVLTVECDLPGPLPGQLRTRLEAFVQMLDARKRGRPIF